MLFSSQRAVYAVILLNVAGLCAGKVGSARAEDPILEWNAVMLEANAVDCAHEPAATRAGLERAASRGRPNFFRLQVAHFSHGRRTIR
jgi:hypothetical protein